MPVVTIRTPPIEELTLEDVTLPAQARVAVAAQRLGGALGMAAVPSQGRIDDLSLYFGFHRQELEPVPSDSLVGQVIADDDVLFLSGTFACGAAKPRVVGVTVCDEASGRSFRLQIARDAPAWLLIAPLQALAAGRDEPPSPFVSFPNPSGIALHTVDEWWRSLLIDGASTAIHDDCTLDGAGVREGDVLRLVQGTAVWEAANPRSTRDLQGRLIVEL